MTDHIKYLAKINWTIFSTYMKMAVIGLVNLAVSLVVALIFLVKGLMAVSREDAIGFTVLKTSFLIFLLLGIVLSFILILNKSIDIAIRKGISRLLHERAEMHLLPLLNKIASGVERHRIVRKGLDYTNVKILLIQNARKETKNPWLRRMLVFILKRIPFNIEAYAKEPFDAENIISRPVIEKLKALSKPDYSFYVGILVFHWIAVLVVILLV